jgi:CHAT domain-containing protein
MHFKFRILSLLLSVLLSHSVSAQTTWQEVNERFKKQFAAGKYTEASLSCDSALQLAIRLHGRNHENYGKSLKNMGVLRFTLGDYAQAGAYFTEALAVQEKVHGTNSTEAISTLTNLAVLYKAQLAYDKSRATMEDVLNRINKGPGKESDVYNRALIIYASLQTQLGQYNQARTRLLEAQALTLRRKGKETIAYADVLNDLAINAENLGDLQAAKQHYEEALQIVKGVQGENNLVSARLLGNIGSIYKQLGLTVDAENALLKSVSLYRQLSSDSNAAAAPLNNLGTLYLEKSNPRAALDCFEQSAVMYRSSRTENSKEYGMCLNNLGLAHKEMGHYSEAQECYRQALGIRTKVLGEMHPDVAATLSNMAVLYEELNNHTLSLQHHVAAAEIRKTVLGMQHPEYAESVYNMARIYAQLKNFDKASEMHRQALEIRTSVFGANSLPVAESAEAMAAISSAQKKYAEAEGLYLKAGRIYRQRLGKYNEPHAMSMYNMASLYVSWRKYDQSSRYFDTTFRLLDSLPHLRRLQMQCRAAHCGLLLAENNTEKLATTAVDFQQWLMADCRKLFRSLSEAEQNQYAFIVFHHFDMLRSVYLRLLPAQGHLASHLLEIELFTKGMTLQMGIEMRRQIQNSGDAEALQQFESLLLLNQRLADAYRNKQLNAFAIQELESRQRSLEQELNKRSALYRGSDEKWQQDWKRLRDRLTDDEAWVEYVRFRVHGRYDWTDTTLYLAIVVRKTSTIPVIIPLFEEKQLNRLLNDAPSGDALYRGGKTVSAQTNHFSYGKELYRLVWQPLETQLGTVKKISFTAAGQLQHLSFAALPADSQQVLSDRYELTQLKSGNSLLMPETPGAGKGPFVLSGGIDYDARGKGKGLWTYLPGTGSETKAIQELAASNGFSVNTLTGAAATESALQNLCRKQAPEVLHISTHGYFKVSGDTTKQLQDYLTQRGSAMNQAGLLFAGANAGWDNPNLPESENGILTALEAGNLQLQGTRLVALSACETAVGEISESEGVFGLQRAFWLAGADYILMSLWKVPDTETAVYMEAFYTHYCKYRDPRQAYLHAQHTMKTRYRTEPYRWAAFILVR